MVVEHCRCCEHKPVDDSERHEMYSVDQIRAAFHKHASDDDWGVPSFYETTLIPALRGEYDDKENH